MAGHDGEAVVVIQQQVVKRNSVKGDRSELNHEHINAYRPEAP